ncbi:MAG: VOC family protein [Ilumatobacteraceae bacterium]
MILTEIDHIAIAVRDLEAAIAYYEEAFGAVVHHREIVESDGVEEALVKVADSYIQLTAATRPDSPIARSIEKRGEGLHHVGSRRQLSGSARRDDRGRCDTHRPGPTSGQSGDDRRLHPPQGQLRHAHRTGAGESRQPALTARRITL